MNIELPLFFKSVVDADESAIVLCDINNTIVYMNPSAIRMYANRGGASLVGHSIRCYHGEDAMSIIKMIASWFEESPQNNKVFTSHNDEKNIDSYMIALRDDNGNLIGYYEKHENRNPETKSRYQMD